MSRSRFELRQAVLCDSSASRADAAYEYVHELHNRVSLGHLSRNSEIGTDKSDDSCRVPVYPNSKSPKQREIVPIVHSCGCDAAVGVPFFHNRQWNQQYERSGAVHKRCLPVAETQVSSHTGGSARFLFWSESKDGKAASCPSRVSR
jgi:hypothetical protein